MHFDSCFRVLPEGSGSPMVRDELHTVPVSLAGRLDPIRVQQYLRAVGWQHKPLPGNGQVALYQRPESKREQLLIPLSHELGDFASRMAASRKPARERTKVREGCGRIFLDRVAQVDRVERAGPELVRFIRPG
jgi:hypothetical protein